MGVGVWTFQWVSFSAFSILSTSCQNTFNTSIVYVTLMKKERTGSQFAASHTATKFIHAITFDKDTWACAILVLYFVRKKNLLSFLCLQHWWQHDVLMTSNLLRPFFSNEISSRFTCRNLYHISIQGWQNQLKLNFIFSYEFDKVHRL